MPDESHVLSLPMTGAYVRLILRRFGATAEKRARLLRGTGLGRDVAGRASGEITVKAQLRLLANLNAFAPPSWGLEMGAALDGSTHGLAGAVTVTAPSLGEALESLARYATVRAPFIDLRGHAEGERYRLRLVEPCSLGAVRTSILEMVLLSVQGVVESALGYRMDEGEFTMPAPHPSYWRRYAQVFHAPVRFLGREASVSLPEDWLDLPCPLADARLHRNATAELEATRQRFAAEFVDARVEGLLETADHAPTLAAVAARLRLSPRTLVRRLARRNTSYRVLLDGHRSRRAAELLAQPELSVAEIAAELGYEDPTNFGRACRRWFGLSPRAYRAKSSL